MAGNHDKAFEDTGDLLRSPTIPNSPAPAYSTLPYRDVDFHFAPLLNGRVGEIELETVDGKRFLVHQKVLEPETVFFHIYYGFVPVWRINQAQAAGAAPRRTSTVAAAATPAAHVAAGALSNLLCLPKIVASALRATSPAPPPIQLPQDVESAPLLSVSPALPLTPNAARAVPPPSAWDSANQAPPPRIPPKDVMAPTPTTDPYTWTVPETAPVLEAFLSLIYPAGTFTPRPDALLTNVHLTARVCRAALGYQSSKALNAARDRLSAWIATSPVEVYAIACFFKFADLAKLASREALCVPRQEWSQEARNLMGRRGAAALIELQETRLRGLRMILDREMEQDGHSATCVRRAMIEQVWQSRRDAVAECLRPESELLELLHVDLRGGHCGDCMVLLGTTIQGCLYAARELPRSV